MTPPAPRRRSDGAVHPRPRRPAPPRHWPCAHLEPLLDAELAAGNAVADRHPSPSHVWGEFVMLVQAFRLRHEVAPPVAFRVLDDPLGWGSGYLCAEHGSQLLGPAG